MNAFDKLVKCFEASKRANSALYIEYECDEGFCGVIAGIMDTDAIVGSDFDLIYEEDHLVDAIERLYDKIQRDGVKPAPAAIIEIPPYES